MTEETSYPYPYNAIFCIMKFHADQYFESEIPFREAADRSQSSEINGQLFSAAERGNVREVEQMLQQGADINFQHIAGTPLTRAARRGHLECVELLLDKGADVNLSGRFNCQTCTALHAAASNGHFSVAKLLLDRGANVNATRDQGSMPLHDACKFGHPDIAQLLLELGAEKNGTNSRKKTPLFLAVSEGKLDGLRWVLEAVLEYYHYRGYCYSPDFFPKDGVDYLLDSQKKVNSLEMSDLELLRTALLNDDVNTIKLILEERPAGNIAKRQLELVKILLAAGVDTEIKHEYDTGALEEAILNRDNGCVQLLIQYGANINRTGSTYGYVATPLHACCNRGTADILETLLENGGDPNGIDSTGRTPLHVAAHEKLPEFVKILLKYGASVNVLDEKGRTPLHMVKSLDCAKLLVEHGADAKVISKRGESVLFNAADRTGEGSCVRYLIEQGADHLLKNEEGKSAFDLAVSRYEMTYNYDKRDDDDGGAECARVLLEYGVEMVPEMNIFKALQRRYLGLLVVILHNLDKPVDQVINAGKTALCTAVACNYASAVKLFLEKGADPNKKCNNMSPLRTALVKGFDAPARVLLEAGAILEQDFANNPKAVMTYEKVLKQMNDLNRQDENGVALIHLICARGQPIKVLDMLLEAGANANIADVQGVTPLHLVSFTGRTDLVERLLRSKADTNKGDKNGMSPLHYAALKGRRRVAECLLEHGADPNAQDNKGNTAAHIAVDNLSDEDGTKFLRMLLSHGGDLNVKNLIGSTPLHTATGKGLDDCIKLLVEQCNGNMDHKPEGCIPSELPDLSFYHHIQELPDDDDDDSDMDMGFGLFD